MASIMSPEYVVLLVREYYTGLLQELVPHQTPAQIEQFVVGYCRALGPGPLEMARESKRAFLDFMRGLCDALMRHGSPTIVVPVPPSTPLADDEIDTFAQWDMSPLDHNNPQAG